MNGKQLSIPVQKNHYLMFPPPKDGSPLPRLVSPDYSAFPEPTKGFCAEDIAGRSKIDSVLLDKTANKKIAEQLTLPSAESLFRFQFGNAIRDLVRPNPISLDSTDPNHFRRTKPFNEVLNRQYMETAGWLKDEYRIASSCAVYPHETDKTCIIKVKLKSSGLVFEAWGLKIPDWPQENQPPPAVFIEFAEKSLQSWICSKNHRRLRGVFSGGLGSRRTAWVLSPLTPQSNPRTSKIMLENML